MNRIGVIAVGRDCADVLDSVLAPWIDAMARHDIRICLLSATFKGMEGILPPAPDEATVRAMQGYHTKHAGRINAVAFDGYMTEAEVREVGRRVLMKQGVDLIWLLDCDELYTADNIDRIIAFVNRTPLVTWYKLSLRNYVFDDKTYLVDPFTPPRIWRCKAGEWVLHRCTYDNDMVYSTPAGVEVADVALSTMTIPPALVLVKHLSWMNDARGQMKVRYQERHFAHGGGCSYAWDPVRGLVFNPAWYARNRLPLPETVREDSP